MTNAAAMPSDQAARSQASIKEQLLRSGLFQQGRGRVGGTGTAGDGRTWLPDLRTCQRKVALEATPGQDQYLRRP